MAYDKKADIKPGRIMICIRKMNINPGTIICKRQSDIIHSKYISLSAQITVMAAMVFMIVVSFVTTCVNAALMSGYNTIIKQACSLSDESVFTAYSNDLLSTFDIFALKKSDIMNDKIYQYIGNNINTYSKDISLTEAEYTSYKCMTDNGGYGVEEQIVKYMQSGGYADIIRDYNAVNENIRQSENVNKITESIYEAQDNAYESWSIRNRLISACQNMSDKEYEISEIMNAHQKNVYDLYSQYNEYDEYDIHKAKKDAEAITEAARKIEYIAEEINEITEEINDLRVSYETYKDELKQSLDGCYEKLDHYRQDIGETLYQELNMDIETMYTGYDDTADISVGDINAALDNDNSAINVILNHISSILKISENIIWTDEYYYDEEYSYNKESDTDDNGQYEYIVEIKRKYDDVISECNDFYMKNLAERYSSEQSDNAYDNVGGETGELRNIYRLLKEGIAGLVIDGDISDKTIDYTDLAHRAVSGSAGGDGISNMGIRSALVNEYIITRYVSYIDYIEQIRHKKDGYSRDKTIQEDRQLDYEIEYILCRKSSDRDNLNEVLMKLSLIREGVNLAYLITDEHKKNECFTLAVQFAGYTGNMAVVKAVQYLIMSVWAYTESVVELRNLYRGESIAAVKNADSWITDIVGVMSLDTRNLSSGEIFNINNVARDSQDTYNSLDYEDYMRVLLLMQDRVYKNAGIMSVMELVMIALGHTEFRMKDYIYGADGEAVFMYIKNSQSYRQKLGYSYV